MEQLRARVVSSARHQGVRTLTDALARRDVLDCVTRWSRRLQMRQRVRASAATAGSSGPS
nr:hypothetical protein [Streptomyces rectiverticillatus]